MVPQILTEDELYRTSTQYRLWSFTPETLGSLRETSHDTASAQVLSARYHTKTHDESSTVLTPAEELTLLHHHTRNLLRIALKHLNLPTPVAATGAVYLKRFYLSHSLLTYPAAAVMPTCLFLATKTEHYYVPLSTFAKKWKPEIQPEQVTREEGTVTQALRFCFDVRHPFRGLRGALMDLRALAQGKDAVVPDSEGTSQHAQEEMLTLPLPSNTQSQSEEDSDPQRGEKRQPPRVSVKQAQDRAFQAHDRAKEVLASSALLSDACFLYSPAQMMFAALLIADEPLALFYLSTKLPRRPHHDPASDAASAMTDKVIYTIRACAALLTSVREPSHDEVARLERKVEECRRVLDASGGEEASKGSKRDGTDVADEQGQSAKKRRLVVGGEEGKSPFGGVLTDSAGNGT